MVNRFAVSDELVNRLCFRLCSLCVLLFNRMIPSNGGRNSGASITLFSFSARMGRGAGFGHEQNACVGQGPFNIHHDSRVGAVSGEWRTVL